MIGSTKGQPSESIDDVLTKKLAKNAVKGPSQAAEPKAKSEVKSNNMPGVPKNPAKAKEKPLTTPITNSKTDASPPEKSAQKAK